MDWYLGNYIRCNYWKQALKRVILEMLWATGLTHITLLHIRTKRMNYKNTFCARLLQVKCKWNRKHEVHRVHRHKSLPVLRPRGIIISKPTRVRLSYKGRLNEVAQRVQEGEVKNLYQNLLKGSFACIISPMQGPDASVLRMLVSSLE